MKYVLENEHEATRLERQSQSTLYDPMEELEGLEIGPQSAILDAGCGSGLVARAIARRFPGSEVHAMDASPERIADARKFAGVQSNIQFRSGNLTNPVTGHYDRIVCRFVLEHMTDSEQIVAVGHLSRALKPGGRLRLIDIDGGMLNIFPQTSLVAESLKILESKRAIDFFAGRKLPRHLIDAGLSNVTWRIQTMSMDKPHLVQEEATLVEERFKNALPLMAELLGSTEQAERFQAEYLECLRRPGTTLFYNKFIATGCRPNAIRASKLRSV